MTKALNVLAAVVVITMAVLLGLAWLAPQMLYADPPSAVPAIENSGTGNLKAMPVENKELIPVDLGSGVYRVDVVIAGNPGASEKYEAAYVKFCKEHADSCVEVSPARENGHGATTAWFWRVVGKK